MEQLSAAKEKEQNGFQEECGFLIDYRERQNIFDPELSYYPPRFLSTISDNFKYRA